MSNTGRASQKKGAEGERELASRLRAAGHPVIWGGNKSYGERPDLSGLPGIHLEVKRVERLNLHAAMKQARADADRFHDGFPTVFQRRTGEEWLVTMSLPSWLTLYDGWQAAKEYKSRTGRTLYLDEVKKPNKENEKMKAKYWETEKPIVADTGRNVLEYYPEGEALAVCRPNFEKDGKVYRGKSVALDVAALKRCPAALEILRSILT